MCDIHEQARQALTHSFVGSLATVDADGRPWVRSIMFRVEDGLVLRFATTRSSRKLQQIQHQPLVHISGGGGRMEAMTKYFQIEGRASILEGPEIREAFWQPGFQAYFDGPQDPEYTVVEIQPIRVVLHDPEQGMQPVTVDFTRK